MLGQITDDNSAHTENVIRYHEAGHAVMAIACGAIVISVEAGKNPYTHYVHDKYLPKQCSALILAAGGAAHFIMSGAEDDCVMGDMQDQKQALQILSELGHSDAYIAYLSKASEILKSNWEAVKSIAEILSINDFVPQSDILEITPKVSKLDINSITQEMNELVSIFRTVR